MSALLISQRAENGRLQSVAKHERPAVAGRQAQEFAFRLGDSDLLRSAHNPAQRLDLFALLGNQQLRVADNVDKKDMPDLQLNF